MARTRKMLANQAEISINREANKGKYEKRVRRGGKKKNRQRNLEGNLHHLLSNPISSSFCYVIVASLGWSAL